MQTLHLKPDKQTRIIKGHLWAFAGEIAESLKGLATGDPVALCESHGRLLGRGYVNPQSLIAVRLLTRREEEWDERLFIRRVESALRYRESVYPDREAYRLIYAESDGLPGLIVDRFGGHLILQSLTAGIERRLDDIVAALVEVIKPESIYFKGLSPFRKLEGLPEVERQLVGTTPDDITFRDGDLFLTAHPKDGQKNGFYLDQAQNRQLVRSVAPGKRVLDLHCYTGAWGISALKSGAREAVMVDSSAKSIAWGREDAERNGVANRALFVEADVEDFLKDAASRKEHFDIVIIDPPALVPNRTALERGARAYVALNRAALKVVAPGGFLVTCSCSHLMTREMHLASIGEAAAREGKHIRLAASGGHPPDHPVLPGHPETEYLKCWLIRVE